MGRVADRIALVTGAGTGIGRATATRLHEEGATLVVTDIDSAAAHDTARALGGETLALQHDVGDEQAWRTVMDAVLDRFHHLDILVNNAGILATADRQTIEDTDLAQWRAVQRVNVEGVYLGCHLAVEAMKARGGAIVNLSSIAGILGTPHLVAYGASKAAVRQLTKSVAAHCGKAGYRIRCNSVHPGPIQTRMGDALFSLGGADVEQTRKARSAAIPLGDIGEVTDVANCVLFLASDEARYVTGAELVVDGGYCVL